jgi:hypothetical protein
MQELDLGAAAPELTGLFFSIHHQFDGLQNACEFLENAIAKETKRRHRHAHRERHGKTIEEQAFMSVAIEDNLFEIERDFPRIVRYSLFVTMMSVTEACLVRLCRVARRRLEITDEFNEQRVDVIQRALKYLKNKAGIDTSTMLYYQKLADSLRKLRNAITHTDGCIKGRHDEASIRTYATQTTGVKIDKGDNIVLSDRFVANNAHGMKKLIILLHDKLKKRVAAYIAK